MPFIKLGETNEVKLESLDSCISQISPEVLDNFKKFAANLKKVAPKAEDFLYFSAVMMHAAESSALNDDGSPKLNVKGETVQVGWDKSGNTWRWMSNDPSVKPYKNSNGDIFPEEELVKSHSKWKGKPLCIDHKSSSVDHTRGFIVDTYYDRNLKRVVALCALDKANYPDLARKVSTGMQTCVSMGTAVGRAICTDCARVARTESDFCDHMRKKSCYGEINVDLNPLELSIVVNGADPKANIKHIIAAANTLNTYVENKQRELNKIATSYSATIIRSGDPTGSNVSNMNTIDVRGDDLSSFKNDFERAVAELESINSKISGKDTNDLVFDQLAGTVSDTPTADSGLAPPHARYASEVAGADAINQLREVTQAIETKLGLMKQSLENLAQASIHTQEENMSGSNETVKKGYYQGAGGVNEPTPGQAKYPKDPLNEQLREKEDRQMVGQSPFPGVGSVDGMHPSPDSAEQSNELERKKMLARAEAEERAQRRQAIVDLAKSALENKRAYYQGGGGVNEPTPGKVKYPIDKLNEQLRDREDKQMVGQKPFPGVGSVDGLHPSPSSAETSDELKRKELLRRASALRAKFARVKNQDGSLNVADSAWEVYQGDNLMLIASVNELSGGQPSRLYESIATKEFGTKLIETVKAHGIDRVRALVKQAQVGDPGAPPAPPADSAPPADAGAPPMDAPPAEDAGKSGDPAAAALELAEKGRDLSSDLVEAVRALTGDQAEMGEGEAAPPAGPEMGASASFSTATLNNLRKELNGALTTAMKEAVATLNDHVEELDMISGIYDKGAITNSNKEFVGSIVDDALSEARTAIADGFQLMTAFVKYARGTKAIVKRAEIEAELNALAEGDTMSEHDANNGDDLMAMISDTNSDLDEVKGLMADDNDGMGGESELEGLLGDVDMPADDNDMKGTLEVAPNEKAMIPPGFTGEVKQASFSTREGRMALRAKLAADALGKEEDGEIQDMSHAKFSDMLQEADHLADGQTQLDTKPSDGLGKVETLPEVNKAMMDVAKAPPKVRKEAEAIQKLVSEGKLDPSDLDALVAEGLDKDAVSYWKKFYSQTDGGSEFASELVKEHVKAQLEAELNKYRVKLARSYELAYDMVDRGLCHHDRNAVSAQVDEIMKFNDDSFDSLKRVVARHPVTNLRKEGGRLPQVGMIGSGEVNTTAQSDDWSQLSAAFAKTSKRLF
jgi:hypothetical protein